MSTTAQSLYSYAEKLGQTYNNEPEFQGFSYVLSQLDFSEATDLLDEVRRFHVVYLKCLQNDKYSFSEQDYSFASFMDFLKQVGRRGKEEVGKGLERQSRAFEALQEGITDPFLISKLGSRAEGLIDDLYSKATGAISQKQYEDMLRKAEEERKYGTPQAARKAAWLKAVDEGWERDWMAKNVADFLLRLGGGSEKGVFTKGDAPAEYQMGKWYRQKMLQDLEKAGEQLSPEEQATMQSYFGMLDEPDAPAAPAAQEKAPKTAPNPVEQAASGLFGKAKSGEISPDDPGTDDLLTTKQKKQSKDRKGKEWQASEDAAYADNMYNGNYREGMHGRTNSFMEEGEMDYMANMDLMNYACDYMEKHGIDSAEFKNSFAGNLDDLLRSNVGQIKQRKMGLMKDLLQKQVQREGQPVDPELAKGLTDVRARRKAGLEDKEYGEYMEDENYADSLDETLQSNYEKIKKRKMGLMGDLLKKQVQREGLPVDPELAKGLTSVTARRKAGLADDEYAEDESMYRKFMAKAARTEDPKEKATLERQAKEYYKPKKSETSGDSDPGAKRKQASARRMYEAYMTKAENEKDPEKKAKLRRQAQEYKAKMSYAEAVRKGNTTYAEKLLSTARDIVELAEGMSYTEKNYTVGDILGRAANYSYMEGIEYHYANDHKPTGGKSKFAPDAENSVTQGYAEEELMAGQEGEAAPATAGEGAISEEQIQELLANLSPEELAMLMSMLQEALGQEGEAPMGGGSAVEGEGDMSMGEYGDASSKDKDKKEHMYSEKLKQEDAAQEQFVQDCKACFSEWEYVNQYYNVPLQFGEESNFDFSEWIDAFRRANSASFDLYGEEVGFDGNLPGSITVVQAEHPNAAWAVYDQEGKFVTLSGIKAFEPLNFSETFKKEYCGNTQGSRWKSDRVARAALCYH